MFELYNYSGSFKIGYATFEAKLAVANCNMYDVLIGLDFLRRHNCVIDLEGNRFELIYLTHDNYILYVLLWYFLDFSKIIIFRLIMNESLHAEFVSEDEVTKWIHGRESKFKGG